MTISNEWQALSRRVKEDLHLWQQLAGARTSEAMWSAYMGFWQEAAEDYCEAVTDVHQLRSKTQGHDPGACGYA